MNMLNLWYYIKVSYSSWVASIVNGDLFSLVFSRYLIFVFVCLMMIMEFLIQISYFHLWTSLRDMIYRYDIWNTIKTRQIILHKVLCWNIHIT